MKRILLLLSLLLLTTTIQANRCCVQPYSDAGLPCFNSNLCCMGNQVYSWLGMNGFFGEFLYWNLYSDELRWATKHVKASSSATVGTNNLTAYIHKLDFSPGFRIGCHHIFPCSENDMTITWTYYWNSHSDSLDVQSLSGATITTVDSPYTNEIDVSTTNTDQNFKSSFAFRLNRLDFTFGQNAQLWNCLVINYYGGGVFWASDEDLSVHGVYTQGTTITLDEKNNLKTTFRGGGVQAGLRLNWNLWKCLTLSVNGGFAGTVGPYNLNETINSVEPAVTITSNNPITYWTGRYAANVGIVVRYTLNLCDQCVFYSSLGWEYFQYFNQTSFQVRQADLTVNGFSQAPTDLELHGLTFTLGTTF